MRYLILAYLLTHPFLVQADSKCQKLYEKEVQRISEKSDVPARVGDRVYINPYSGGLGYSPGIEMTSYGPNWAREFLGAILEGPEMTSFSITKGKKKEFLAGMKKELSSVCKLKEDFQYKNLRAFLKQQLDQQSFCPEGKILKPTLFGSFKRFHKVAQSALQDSDDFGLCDQKVIQDDSHRLFKEHTSTKSKNQSQKSRVKQN